VWWFTLVIPAFGRVRQENCKFKANLSYIARPCLKIKQNTHTQKKPHKIKVKQAKMSCFPFYLFSFFFYKIGEWKGRTGPAQGGVGWHQWEEGGVGKRA
jgi:hypothetical protein